MIFFSEAMMSDSFETILSSGAIQENNSTTKLKEKQPGNKSYSIEVTNTDETSLLDFNKIDFFRKTFKPPYGKKADYAFIVGDKVIIIELKCREKLDKKDIRKQLLCSKSFIEYCINLKNTFRSNGTKYEIILICLVKIAEKRPPKIGLTEYMSHNITYIYRKSSVHFNQLKKCSAINKR